MRSSPASFAGLQAGDVIVEADHRPVAKVEDLRDVLAKASGKVLDVPGG